MVSQNLATVRLPVLVAVLVLVFPATTRVDASLHRPLADALLVRIAAAQDGMDIVLPLVDHVLTATSPLL